MFHTRIHPNKNIIVPLLLTIFCSFAIHAIYAIPNPKTYKIISYLPLWKEWQARDIDVQKLTHINLAFAGMADGMITNEITPSQLQAIRKMKKINKQLKVLISIGGWEEGGLSTVALTYESRIKFVKSIINYLHHNQLDGVDIDWEFPVVGSGSEKGLPEDKENFTLLMQVLREQLNQREKKDHKKYLLTFAANISLFYINSIELEKLTPLVDYINLMTYDFHGKWERTTGFHTNLYSTPEDPTALSADLGVKRYISAGVPPEKLILGTAFYGYGWSGVSNINNGRYQTVSGECKSYSYQNLAQNYINRNGFLRYWDDQAKAPYLWNGNTFITYEDEESLVYRTLYIRANQLGGIMIWEYCHNLDDTLLNTIFHELHY
jgi:chitinase